MVARFEGCLSTILITLLLKLYTPTMVSYLPLLESKCAFHLFLHINLFFIFIITYLAFKLFTT